MWKIFCLFVIFIVCNYCQRLNVEEKELMEKIFNNIDVEKMENLPVLERKKYFLEVLSQNEDLKQLALKEASELKFMNRNVWIKDIFPCQNYSIPGSGKNVSNLTPLDIKVIAALGDSLTAGIGIDATSIFGLLLEDRGKAFDIGGKDGAQTLPNMLKIFNPNIRGYSTKVTFIGSKGDALNVAVSGGTSDDLMDQLDNLLKKLKDDPSIDMKNDWKIISIFIGNNDICRSCESDKADRFTAKLFKERLIAVIDKLKNEVPKVFVNLITMLEIYRVHELNKGIICSAIHLYECPCVAFSSNLTKVIETTAEFQTAVSDISEQYPDELEFAVITQPFFENTFVPTINNEPDLSYFAPDCFHLSEKGQAQVALSLWNSLFEPVSTKKRDWYVGEKFICPSDSKPFFATKSNYV